MGRETGLDMTSEIICSKHLILWTRNRGEEKVDVLAQVTQLLMGRARGLIPVLVPPTINQMN